MLQEPEMFCWSYITQNSSDVSVAESSKAG